MAITATLAGSDVDSQLSFINVFCSYSLIIKQELLYSFTYLIDALAIAYLINSTKFEIQSRIEYVALGTYL